MALSTELFTVCISTIFIILISQPVKSSSIVLNEDNWHQISKGEWMVKFHATWCPACKALIKSWAEFARWSDDLDIKVGEVDVTDNPGLSGRFVITALPTIFHVKDGVFRRYVGAREHKDFIEFVEENKWKEMEELESWKQPTHVHMALIGQFFKLSMMLRSVHTTLQEVYGLPSWGSYAVFALITVITGCILGLVIVAVIDCIWPAQTKFVGDRGKLKKDSDEEEESNDKVKNGTKNKAEEDDEEGESGERKQDDAAVRKRNTNVE